MLGGHRHRFIWTMTAERVRHTDYAPGFHLLSWMLAAHSHALRRTGFRGRSCYSAHYADSVQDSRLPRRRTFLGSAVTSLSEGLLDLSLALPLPPSFPPYASTIILATVATRLVFTVPFAIWVRYLCSI
jgi:hypothetical protein